MQGTLDKNSEAISEVDPGVILECMPGNILKKTPEHTFSIHRKNDDNFFEEL